MQAEGWFRCPHFRFRFDNSLEHHKKMDVLFAKVEEELKKGMYTVGTAGNDTLYGYAGNDILEGGTGNDNLYGYETNYKNC